GIPIGLAASIPFMLQSSYYTGSYQAQATFSLVIWPFSFKLAWAPIIDSIYSTHIGRRKTWLIPTQYAIGIELIILANYINSWLGRDPNNPWSPLGTHHPVDIIRLTVAFFGLTFLAATQDIAVDGWAISILSKLGNNFDSDERLNLEIYLVNTFQ
ncbi:MFS transporter, PAT family, solute carrier family 33 (acetyl-CoA transporter), member 1, partial [Schistosoma bovis]